MPIVQDRLIKLVAHADVLLCAFDDLRRHVRQIDVPNAMAICNSIIEHASDDGTKNAANEVASALGQLYQAFNEIEIPPELRDNITEERTHFKANRKANEALAAYRRYKRQAAATMKISVAQIPQFFDDVSETLPPSAASNGEQAQEPAEPTAQAAAWKPDIDGARNALEAEGRLKPKPVYKTRQERDAERQGAGGASGETNALTMRSHSYDPSVLRTSVPTLAQLNVQGTASADEDVL